MDELAAQYNRIEFAQNTSARVTHLKEEREVRDDKESLVSQAPSSSRSILPEFRLSLIWTGAVIFIHVCVDSSLTVLEHHRSFATRTKLMFICMKGDIQIHKSLTDCVHEP